jgi:hypothetical protein
MQWLQMNAYSCMAQKFKHIHSLPCGKEKVQAGKVFVMPEFNMKNKSDITFSGT